MIRQGYVYVIDYGDGETFKIGCTTTNPEKRMSQINKAAVLMPKKYGMQLVMSGEVSNCYYLEQLLHSKFDVLHDNGEWYKLGFPELVEVYQILSLLSDEAELYDRWFDLLPDDTQAYFEHGVILTHYPRLRKK